MRDDVGSVRAGHGGGHSGCRFFDIYYSSLSTSLLCCSQMKLVKNYLPISFYLFFNFRQLGLSIFGNG